MTKQVKVTTKTYTLAEIDGAIQSVEKTAKSLQQKIHNTAVSILYHWHEKAEGTSAEWAGERITALQNASPYHAASFAKWVGFVLPFVWAEESEKWVPDHHKLSDDSIIMGKNFKQARDGDPFWKLSPPPKPKPLTLVEEFAKLIDRGTKRAQSPEKQTEQDVLDNQMLVDFAAALAETKARLGMTG